jgi:hypothetical protein
VGVCRGAATERVSWVAEVFLKSSRQKQKNANNVKPSTLQEPLESILNLRISYSIIACGVTNAHFSEEFFPTI